MGRIAAMVYPSGRRIEYIRDENDRLNSIATDFGRVLVWNINHLEWGREAGWAHSNGVVATREFDDRGQLTRLIAEDVLDLAFERDESGDITAIKDHLFPEESQQFAYDDQRRLTRAKGGYGEVKYTYDPMTNRLSREVDGESETYTYQKGTNRLTQVSGPDPVSFEYDQAGRIVKKNEMSLGYDSLGRLVRVEVEGQLSEYVYNAKSQRVIKTSGGTTTVYHYDQAGLLIAETDGQGETLREYVYLGNELISIIDRDNNLFHVHTNHRQEPQAVTDSVGNVVWRSCSSSFGRAEVNEDPSDTGTTFTLNVRLPGQYFDQETGFHYNWHRFYDPGIGRYLTPDPIGFDGGMNLFAYVKGNPVNLVDPEGLYIYKGICKYISGGELIGAGQLRCDVWTECYNGKRHRGELLAWFGGFTVGKIPLGGTVFNIKQDDERSKGGPSLHYMEGISAMMQASVALGYGVAGTYLVLGDTTGVSADTQFGFDSSIDIFGGYSWLEQKYDEECYDHTKY